MRQPLTPRSPTGTGVGRGGRGTGAGNEIQAPIHLLPGPILHTCANALWTRWEQGRAGQRVAPNEDRQREAWLLERPRTRRHTAAWELPVGRQVVAAAAGAFPAGLPSDWRLRRLLRPGRPRRAQGGGRGEFCALARGPRMARPLEPGRGRAQESSWGGHELGRGPKGGGGVF